MENNKSKFVNVIIIVLVIVAIMGTGVLLYGTGKLKFITDYFNTNSNKEEVTLKYTTTTNVKTDGVYITDVSDVVSEVMPSIVSITSKTIINSGSYGSFFYGGSYTAEGAGSGVIVAENDNEIYILTNYHVVEDTTELSVKFYDDKSYDASIKGVSERKDVAIVSVNKKSVDTETLKNIKIATIGDSNELKVGNGIIAIGNALGYGQSVTTGVVSALNREISTDNYVQKMIQIDAAINGGNSGGALLNSRGEVVGINTAKYSNNSSSSTSIEGMGFAIPISDVKDLIETLISGQNDTGVQLGIEGYMTNSRNLSGYKMPTGFYITVINSGSNADAAGLEIGNIITQVDNTEITSFDSLKKVLSNKEKGDKVTVKIKYAEKNQYKEKQVEVTLN